MAYWGEDKQVGWILRLMGIKERPWGRDCVHQARKTIMITATASNTRDHTPILGHVLGWLFDILISAIYDIQNTDKKVRVQDR